MKSAEELSAEHYRKFGIELADPEFTDWIRAIQADARRAAIEDCVRKAEDVLNQCVFMTATRHLERENWILTVAKEILTLANQEVKACR